MVLVRYTLTVEVAHPVSDLNAERLVAEIGESLNQAMRTLEGSYIPEDIRISLEETC